MTDDKTFVQAIKSASFFMGNVDGSYNRILAEAADRLEDLSRNYSQLCKEHERVLAKLKNLSHEEIRQEID